MQPDIEAFKRLLIKHEGLELKAYVDSVGKVTIGVGRNLTDVGLSSSEAMALLEHDVALVLKQAMALPWFTYASNNRQLVIMSMIFNLGFERLMGFKNMIQAIINADYMRAADEMLNSKWAKQVGNRAVELAAMMRMG